MVRSRFAPSSLAVRSRYARSTVGVRFKYGVGTVRYFNFFLTGTVAIRSQQVLRYYKGTVQEHVLPLVVSDGSAQQGNNCREADEHVRENSYSY